MNDHYPTGNKGMLSITVKQTHLRSSIITKTHSNKTSLLCIMLATSEWLRGRRNQGTRDRSRGGAPSEWPSIWSWGKEVITAHRVIKMRSETVDSNSNHKKNVRCNESVEIILRKNIRERLCYSELQFTCIWYISSIATPRQANFKFSDRVAIPTRHVHRWQIVGRPPDN